MAEPNRADRKRAKKENAASSPRHSGNTPGQYKTIIITALISTVLTAVMTLSPYVFDLFKGDLKTQIVKEINDTSITPLSREIGELKTQVAVLKNSIDLLEKFGAVGRLKTQASKLGIKDPQITSVDIKPKVGFSAIYAQRDNPKSFVQIDYTLEEILKDTMTVEVRGSVYDRGVLYSQFGPIRQKIPLDKKTFTFKFHGVTSDGKKIPFPAVKIAILERNDDTNNLVLATGLEAQPTT